MVGVIAIQIGLHDVMIWKQENAKYVAHYYEGGCNDDGEVRCTHGWSLTKKWIDEHQERHKAAQKAEYERIDRIGRDEETLESW